MISKELADHRRELMDQLLLRALDVAERDGDDELVGQLRLSLLENALTEFVYKKGPAR